MSRWSRPIEGAWSTIHAAEVVDSRLGLFVGTMRTEFGRRATSILGAESCCLIVKGGLVTSLKNRVQDSISGCFVGIVPTGGAHVDFGPVCRAIWTTPSHTPPDFRCRMSGNARRWHHGRCRTWDQRSPKFLPVQQREGNALPTPLAPPAASCAIGKKASAVISRAVKLLILRWTRSDAGNLAEFLESRNFQTYMTEVST